MNSLYWNCSFNPQFSELCRLQQGSGGMDRRKESISIDFWVLEPLKKRFDAVNSWCISFSYIILQVIVQCCNFSVGVPASDVKRRTSNSYSARARGLREGILFCPLISIKILVHDTELSITGKSPFNRRSSWLILISWEHEVTTTKVFCLFCNVYKKLYKHLLMLYAGDVLSAWVIEHHEFQTYFIHVANFMIFFSNFARLSNIANSKNKLG